MKVILPVLILTVIATAAIYAARWSSRRALKAERRNKELEEQVDILAHDVVEREEKERFKSPR